MHRLCKTFETRGRMSGGLAEADEIFISGLEKNKHKVAFHKFSKKSLQLCINKVPSEYNIRELDPLDQMRGIVSGMVGKELTYDQLIVNNGLVSWARL